MLPVVHLNPNATYCLSNCPTRASHCYVSLIVHLTIRQRNTIVACAMVATSFLDPNAAYCLSNCPTHLTIRQRNTVIAYVMVVTSFLNPNATCCLPDCPTRASQHYVLLLVHLTV